MMTLENRQRLRSTNILQGCETSEGKVPLHRHLVEAQTLTSSLVDKPNFNKVARLSV